MEDFSSWWKQYSTEYVSQYTKESPSYYYLAEKVWNHQQARIDELEAPRKWINVEDRLPAVNELVLAYAARGHNISTVFYNGDSFGYMGKKFIEVTHWIELPVPPNDN